MQFQLFLQIYFAYNLSFSANILLWFCVPMSNTITNIFLMERVLWDVRGTIKRTFYIFRCSYFFFIKSFIFVHKFDLFMWRIINTLFNIQRQPYGCNIFTKLLLLVLPAISSSNLTLANLHQHCHVYILLNK